MNTFNILDYKLADLGFFINLDSSIERKGFIEKQNKQFNIQNLQRFSALQNELRQSSCTESHKQVFRICLEAGAKTAFVGEDDFVFKEKFNFLDQEIYLKDIINNLSSFDNYDVLMFGCNPKKKLIPEYSFTAKNLSSTGAWAYIIKEDAMRYILNNYSYRKDYCAIDDILPSLNGKGFKTMVTLPQICDHRDGIESTLQPHVGVTHYSTWINGNWHKHFFDHVSTISNLEESIKDKYLVPRKLTILITGHGVENWLFYLRYLIKSMPDTLFDCQFIVCYDSCSYDDKFNLSRYFRDTKSHIQPTIEYVTGGLISSLKKALSCINTEYFLWLEHDWVFLKQDIDFYNIVKAMDNNKFINSIWLNKDDNNPRGFDICQYNSTITPYNKESRVNNIDLLTTCRWSNNPAIHRTSRMRYLFDHYINNKYVDFQNQRSHNIEEKIIPIYRDQIEKMGWDEIKDEWGTYLYGSLNDTACMGHTDATRRYQGQSKSMPEINGESYIKNNPLKDSD